MGEDQYATGPRGLDEAQRGHRLAGAGGVLEPEALGGVGVLGLLPELRFLLVGLVVPVLGLLVLGLLGSGILLVVLVVLVVETSSRGSSSSSSSSSSSAAAPRPGCRRGSRVVVLARPRVPRAPRARSAAAVPLPLPALDLGHQRGQRPRQRVDLVGREHGPVDEVRLLLGEDALEAEQQRELAPPRDRRALWPASTSRSQRRAPGAGGAGGERLLQRLAFIDETLAGQPLSARDRVRTRKGGDDTHTCWQVASGCANRGGTDVAAQAARSRPSTARFLRSTPRRFSSGMNRI